MTSSMLSRPVQTRSEHALLETIDSTIRAACLSQGFVEQWYPTLIDRHSLDDAGYREAFPHLLCDVSIGDQASSWCLSPAVCYHTFIALRGACLEPQTKITARNHCYRNEQEIIPGRRQIEFEMRELVLVGSESWIEDQLVWWEQQIGMVARRFGIVASWKAAADPFFLPTSKGKALMQRLLKTKQEYCLSDGLAIASINRHRDYFANRFSIRTFTGLPVHSACIAFGLDRWVCAAGQGRNADVFNAGTPGTPETAAPAALNGYENKQRYTVENSNEQPSTRLALTAEVVLERLHACLPSVELKPDQPLSLHNIDSIDLVELLCTIDAEFSVRISEADLSGDPTPGKLAALVVDRSLDLSHSHSRSL